MITPKDRDAIIDDLKAITYKPLDHKGERLFRLTAIRKILNSLVSEDECYCVKCVGENDQSFEE